MGRVEDGRYFEWIRLHVPLLVRILRPPSVVSIVVEWSFHVSVRAKTEMEEGGRRHARKGHGTSLIARFGPYHQ